jgi:hypothetical protein
MKKTVSILLILVMLFSVCALCACGGSKGPNGRYTGYIGTRVFSSVTFNRNGTFTEEIDGEVWYGTWVIEGRNITCTYDDGSHDYYVFDPASDTLDWKGQGEIIYRK